MHAIEAEDAQQTAAGPAPSLQQSNGGLSSTVARWSRGVVGCFARLLAHLESSLLHLCRKGEPDRCALLQYRALRCGRLCYHPL
jgi:hypothetical protein